MSAKSTQKIRQSLTKKGFVEIVKHHRMLYFDEDNLTCDIITRISHGHKEYGDELLAEMAKQIHLKRKELDRLIGCTMDREEYVQILKTKKII